MERRRHEKGQFNEKNEDFQNNENIALGKRNEITNTEIPTAQFQNEDIPPIKKEKTINKKWQENGAEITGIIIAIGEKIPHVVNSTFYFKVTFKGETEDFEVLFWQQKDGSVFNSLQKGKVYLITNCRKSRKPLRFSPITSYDFNSDESTIRCLDEGLLGTEGSKQGYFDDNLDDAIENFGIIIKICIIYIFQNLTLFNKFVAENLKLYLASINI